MRPSHSDPETASHCTSYLESMLKSLSASAKPVYLAFCGTRHQFERSLTDKLVHMPFRSMQLSSGCSPQKACAFVILRCLAIRVIDGGLVSGKYTVEVD